MNRFHIIRLRRVSIIFLTMAVILCIISMWKLCTLWYAASQTGFSYPDIIIDPGHGGQDGGAVSKNGVSEQDINLAISKKVYYFSAFCGINPIMTRTDGNSLGFKPESTLKQNKSADLVARVKIGKANPSSDFISIHLNNFESSKYFGAQVFHKSDDSSVLLAQSLQQTLLLINTSNNRKAKAIPNKNYLMENIKNTGVIVECGFLSNLEEEIRLQDNTYQTKLAMLITGGYLNYKNR